MLHRSKMGRGEHCSRYMLTKLPKTITLVRKRWFFSKVLRIQDGQENCLWYQYQVIFYTILYSLVTTTFRYQQMTIQKWPWESCMTKGPLLTLLSVIKTHTRDRNSLLWPFFDNTSCFMMVDHSTVQHHFYGWNNWVTLASILDSNTFIEEQPHKVLKTWSRMRSC